MTVRKAVGFMLALTLVVLIVVAKRVIGELPEEECK